MEGVRRAKAAYLRNTADRGDDHSRRRGNAVRITDFIPRFTRFERVFNPPQIFRRIEPIAGLPRVQHPSFGPTFNYGHAVRQPAASGSNHIRYAGGVETCAPHDRCAALLHRPGDRVRADQAGYVDPGAGRAVRAAVDATSREFLERTRDYWLDWVRSLAVPLEYQAEIIRAAITLKLCSFEETGAIMAAHTTSIPEAPGTPANWDYRFCWLRDAYFVIKALNRLGATHTMEDYINYITKIAIEATRPLRPVYGIVADRTARRVDCARPDWLRGRAWCVSATRRPSRLQHDAYGSVILGAVADVHR